MKKAFLIRISPELWEDLNRLAKDELRSVNGQIEHLLRDAVLRRKRGLREEEGEKRNADWDTDGDTAEDTDKTNGLDNSDRENIPPRVGGNVGGTEEPLGPAGTPAVQTSTPVEQTSTPVEQTSTPAVRTATSSGRTSTAAEQVSMSAKQTATQIIRNRSGDIPNQSGNIPSRRGDISNRSGSIPNQSGDISNRSGDVPDPLVDGWHGRGYLPHLKAAGGTYFVTFRLADTLPRKVLDVYLAEREEILKRAQAMGREVSPLEEKRLRELYSEQVESYLDTGHGACWLRYPEVGRLVVEALRKFHGTRYWLHAAVVMPNHVHAVLTPLEGYRLSDILQNWKSFTAHEVQRLVPALPLEIPADEPFWQHESYDHLIRNEADLDRVCAYTWENPVKAGFCARPEEWPYSIGLPTPSPDSPGNSPGPGTFPPA